MGLIAFYILSLNARGAYSYLQCSVLDSIFVFIKADYSSYDVRCLVEKWIDRNVAGQLFALRLQDRKVEIEKAFFPPRERSILKREKGE